MSCHYKRSSLYIFFHSNFVLLLNLPVFRLGWGTQFYTGPISNVLMKVKVPIWNNQACQDVFTVNKIYDTVLCAGASGKDSCQVSCLKYIGNRFLD